MLPRQKQRLLLLSTSTHPRSQSSCEIIIRSHCLIQGEMGLSIMMTTASTLAAIVMTPLLTTWLAGTLVPVDPRALFMSTLQV